MVGVEGYCGALALRWKELGTSGYKCRRLSYVQGELPLFIYSDDRGRALGYSKGVTEKQSVWLN
jgi:hypothetical protein